MSDDSFVKPNQETDAQGLPEFTDEERDKRGSKGAAAAVVFPIISTAIGSGLAYLIYRFGDKDKYDTRILAAKELEGQWMTLGLIIFTLTVAWLNMYPMRFKNRFMGDKGNLRSNMFIYKQATDAEGEGSAIVMNADGDIGAYNRGNRSLHHFLENSLPFVASLPVSFFLFPLPTFVLVCVFCLGRIMHQAGYANGGYGSHGAGFALAAISTNIVLGLLIISYVKMVM